MNMDLKDYTLWLMAQVLEKDEACKNAHLAREKTEELIDSLKAQLEEQRAEVARQNEELLGLRGEVDAASREAADRLDKAEAKARVLEIQTKKAKEAEQHAIGLLKNRGELARQISQLEIALKKAQDEEKRHRMSCAEYQVKIGKLENQANDATKLISSQRAEIERYRRKYYRANRKAAGDLVGWVCVFRTPQGDHSHCKTEILPSEARADGVGQLKTKGRTDLAYVGAAPVRVKKGKTDVC